MPASPTAAAAPAGTNLQLMTWNTRVEQHLELTDIGLGELVDVPPALSAEARAKCSSRRWAS